MSKVDLEDKFYSKEELVEVVGKEVIDELQALGYDMNYGCRAWGEYLCPEAMCIQDVHDALKARGYKDVKQSGSNDCTYTVMENDEWRYFKSVGGGGVVTLTRK